MKDVTLWSRRIDEQVLVVMAFLFAAGVGYALPAPEGEISFRVMNALISAAVGLFAWGVIELVAPLRRAPWRAVAKVIGVATVWLVILAVVALCSSHFRDMIDELWRIEAPVVL